MRVEYRGIEPGYAEAMAKTVSTARQIYSAEFGFEMPPTVVIRVECDAEGSARLWNDGHDRITLTVRRREQLRKPADSGLFHIYGLCHELGHIAMYRTLKERAWLSADAAEGWAYFCGSLMVDRVYEQHGQDLWPDAYDYRDDGLRRLEKQLRSPKPDGVAVLAGHWARLDGLLGRKRLAELFAAWNSASRGSGEASANLKAALLKLAPSDKDAAGWWNDFAPAAVVRIEPSPQAHRTIEASKLSREPITLKHDDGTSEGKKSIAGGAHGVFFDAPDGNWYLTGISLYGARYGTPEAPREDFTVTLCDADYRPIVSWKKPYGLFERGDPCWVDMDVPPSALPPRFAICLDFNPTGTRGVFVHRDDSSSGASVVGQVGKAVEKLKSGNWMIRARIDSARSANALQP